MIGKGIAVLGVNFLLFAGILQADSMPASGVLRETWLNVAGSNVSDLTGSINYPINPSARDFITTFESVPGRVNHGERLRGYVIAPQTGSYVFYISGDDTCELWLSSDTSPANATKIAYNTSSTGLRQLKYSQQTSAKISLVANQRYYIEARHKQGSGGDSISVGWLLPNGVKEFPIPANRLAPYVEYGGHMVEMWNAAQSTGTTWAAFTSGSVLPDFRNVVDNGLSLKAQFASSFIKASGWIFAPTTGTYSFLLATNNRAQVYLSTSEDPAGKRLIGQTKGGKITSAGVSLTAGTKYYFEILAQFSQATNSTALGWRLPDGSVFDSIPRQNLSPNITVGGPVWEFWTDLGGQSVGVLTGSKWFPDEPVSRTQTQLLEAKVTPEWSGGRLKGYLLAPQTGSYRFNISSDDESQLMLSSTTDASLASPIAAVSNGNFTNLREWNKIPDQKSVAIKLEAGKWYYIEALEKNGHNGGHVSVAWTLPDGTFEGPIPGWRFNPTAGRLGNLPVVRITSPVDESTVKDGNSLSVTATVRSLDRPIVKVELFENGVKKADLTGPDFKHTFASISAGDHLYTVQVENDLGEVAHDDAVIHVYPTQDGDGDGITDYEEENQTFTNPNSADITGIETVLSLNGNNFSSSSGSADWNQTANGLISKSVQGWVEYEVDVTSPDVYRMLVQAMPFLVDSSNTLLTLGIEIDGVQTDQVTLPNDPSLPAYAITYTPWLTTGKHKVRLVWKNYTVRNVVIIKGLVFQRLDGAVNPATGKKVWVENRLGKTNGLTVISPGSATSPACIEGIANVFSSVTLSNGVVPQHGIAKGWYANIPLSADAPVSFTVSYENGAKSETKSLSWTPTDILTTSEITIRKGDSLLLTATGGNADKVAAIIQVADQKAIRIWSTKPAPVKFDKTGTFEVKASYFAALAGDSAYDPKVGTRGTLKVTVVDASFDNNPVAWTNRLRTWDCPNIPAAVMVEADPAIPFGKTKNQPATGSQFGVLTRVAADFYTVARIKAGGPILANAVIRGFWVKSSDQVKLEVVKVYQDGSAMIEMDIVMSLITPDMSIILETHLPDVLFDDGTIKKVLTSKDFDSHNLAKVYFIRPDRTGSICHGLTIYQGNAYVGTR